jgi:hypothetical protein
VIHRHPGWADQTSTSDLGATRWQEPGLRHNVLCDPAGADFASMDASWHAATLDFDFSETPTAFHSVFAVPSTRESILKETVSLSSATCSYSAGRLTRPNSDVAADEARAADRQSLGRRHGDD